MSASRKFHIAGISMRFMRSPVAPKKMTLHGSAMRSTARPLRSGFAVAPPGGVVVVVPATPQPPPLGAAESPTISPLSALIACPPN